MSSQPALFNTNERPRHRPVRETSRTAYQAGKAKFNAREKLVATMLEHYVWERSGWPVIDPTSAELARWGKTIYNLPSEWTAAVLMVRRGLADLRAKGAVETPLDSENKLLKRPCAVTGSLCYVWRVRQR